MPYVLPTKAVDPARVGDSYHLALGMTSPGQPSPDRIFGYLLVPGTKFEQNTDLNSKSTLTQYSSPHLIDRDIVNWPRVTDGNFSGGMMQLNWIDEGRYWDSNLDIRTPGFLLLNAAWAHTGILGTAPGTAPQIVNIGTSTVGNWGANPSTDQGGTYVGFGANVKYIDTDGDILFGSDGTNIKYYAGAGTWGVLGGGACAAHDQIWFVDEGTAGRFIYYRPNAVGGLNGRGLMKLDIAGGTRDIAVPMGGSVGAGYGRGQLVVDLCPYQAGIAVVTADPSGSGLDVWAHDGATLQRIVRFPGYTPGGICAALGALYVTASAANRWDPPILLRIDGGTVEIVVRAGLPFIQQTPCQFGPPVTGEHFVYIPVNNPLVAGIDPGQYVGVYDVLTGSFSHYPTDPAQGNFWPFSPFSASVRLLTVQGRSAAFPFVATGAGYIAYQTNSGWYPTNVPTYFPTGWLFSSKIDFATPGISKHIRRLLVSHAPLRAGERIDITAYVDQDPSTLTTASPANPVGATAFNNTVGSTQTVLNLPAHTLGFALSFGLKLTAGTSGLTSPNVYYVSIEIAISWTWKFSLDCSTRRRLLNGGEDDQGLRAKDLIMLIQTAWEQALPLIFYHPNGLTYTAVIEEARFESENPLNRVTPEMAADLEGIWTLTLRDAIV